MKDVLERLTRLEAVLSDAAPPLPPGRASQLCREAVALGRSFAHLDDMVVVGIAGGTGVGKSTLINALAGDRITADGARRPTSDRIVVYQHRASAFATRLPREVLPVEERRHDSDDLRRVVILDLPDPDSIREQHRRMLDLVLPQTDLLLMVTDPSKYGDRTFHDLVASTLHAAENKCIVFNKIDLIEPLYGARSAEVLEDLLRDLADKLGRSGAAPALRTFALSARRAFDARRAHETPCAGFTELTAMLQALREEKLRRRIKRRNLDAAFGHLCSGVRAELDHPRCARDIAQYAEMLDHAARDLDAHGDALVAKHFAGRAFRVLRAALSGRRVAAWSFAARSLARLLRLRFTAAPPEAELLGEKLRAHGRRIARAAHHLHGEFERMWSGGMPPPPGAAPLDWDLRARLDALAAAERPRRFWWVFLAAAAVVLFFAARPGLKDVLAGLREGRTLSTLLGPFLLSVPEQLLAYLHPAFLLFWLLVFAGGYVAVVALSLARVEHDAERDIAHLAAELREALSRAAREHIAPLRAAHEAVERRMTALRAVLDAPRP